jgi:hypothetical protein
MKYAVEMGSGAKIGSAIQKFIAGIHRHTDSMVTVLAYFYFFQNKESRLKNG